jgi:subtilisin family serine protease
MCRRSVPLAGPDTASGPGLDLTLELEGRSAGPDREAPAADQASPSQAPEPRRRNAGSFEFTLERGFDASGGASLGADRLPEDTSDWSLMVNAGCSDVKVPMDALEPARVPGQVTALVDAGTAAALSLAFGVTVIREVELDSTDQALTVFAGADDVAAVAAALALDPRVSAAQPEYVYRTTAENADPAAAAGLPATGTPIEDEQASPPAPPAYSDPFATLSYGPALTGAAALHPSARGRGQLVAVIDTGVDADHADLAGRVRERVDATGNGWSADLHGTAVAGIIAANADNAEGGYGVAPDVELLAIKACQPVAAGALRAKCRTSSLVKALDLAMSRDASVINMSLAGPPDDLVARYVRLAAEQGRLVIAGAGNNGPNARPAHPAALPEVVAVTAVDAARRRYRDANLGDYIDLAAPGVDIISPAPGGSYPPLSGTSMAAAHVSGTAALLRELSPLLDGGELAAVIRAAGRDLGAPGRDAEFGAGLMDACTAAARATADAVTCTDSGGDHDP